MNLRLNRRELLGLIGAGAAAGLRPSLVSGAKGPECPQRAVVRTILKDIRPSELGNDVTLFHELLSTDIARLISRRPANARPIPPPIAVDLMVEEVKAAQKDGITCIVDGGHDDMGRDLDARKQIAQRTGMHIVASGGYYMERNYPPEIGSESEDQISAELARDAGANRFGAFGEIGESANAPMSDLEHKLFRAVGKAHLKPNLPVFTQNAYGTGPNGPKDAGLHQLDAFESVGVKPQRVAIGHTCCLDDPEAEVIKAIAKRGAWVGFDRVNTLGDMVSDEKCVKKLLKFLDAGYADQLLLSSDFTAAEPWRDRYTAEQRLCSHRSWCRRVLKKRPFAPFSTTTRVGFSPSCRRNHKQ